MNQNLAREIIDNLSEDLLKPKFRGNNNPLFCHCYVASECYYYLEDNLTLKPQIIKVGDICHWYLKDISTGEIIDLTAGQFDFELDYSKGRGCGFLTKKPSKRCQTLMKKMKKFSLESGDIVKINYCGATAFGKIIKAIDNIVFTVEYLSPLIVSDAWQRKIGEQSDFSRYFLDKVVCPEYLNGI